MDAKLKVIFAVLLVLTIPQVSAQGGGDWAGDDYLDGDDSSGDQTTDPKCGTNCATSNSCPSCPCGLTTSPEDPQKWCQQNKQWNQACCECIVNEESHGNANAMNWNKPRIKNGVTVKNGTFDIGLWQINQIHFASCNNGKIPCDVTQNYNCAVYVWKAHKNFKPWSTYTKCHAKKQC